MESQSSDFDPFVVHRWWFKLKALLITGALAYPLARVTGFSVSFSWYLLTIGFGLLILSGWAAVELWRDFGPRRN